MESLLGPTEIVDWERLPNEIWSQIIQNLPPSQWNSFRCINTRFYELISSSALMGRRPYINVAIVGPRATGKSTLVGRLVAEGSRKPLHVIDGMVYIVM